MSQDSGAWLIVRSSMAASESADIVALPVPRQACLGLARAVLAESSDPGRWRALCGGDEVVSAWLAVNARADGPAYFRSSGPWPGASATLLTRLSKDLVVGNPPPGAGARVRAVEPSQEAMLLVEAVERMLAHARVNADIDRAIEVARLEAARELAYGAGHEINNPLANIATRAQSLLLEERDAERRRRLATIVDQAFRARDMIGGLMLFARPPRPAAETLDVGDLLRAVADAVEPVAAAKEVTIAVTSPARPLEVVVDRGQVEEALRAIVTNAIEASAVGGQGTLAARVRGDGDPWCEVVVSDHGSGMDEATVRRAFDPFFSGREAGRGAGLGLSKAWRFIEASGGSVVIQSRPGAGTTVTVTLPTASAVRVSPVFPA